MIPHRISSVALVCALCAAPLAAFADLTGAYTVEGRNTDGSRYSGSLTLQQEGETVAAAWVVGSTSYTGHGPLDGRVLTINWAPDQAPVVYVTMPDGTLHGTWANGLALEKATPN